MGCSHPAVSFQYWIHQIRQISDSRSHSQSIFHITRKHQMKNLGCDIFTHSHLTCSTFYIHVQFNKCALEPDWSTYSCPNIHVYIIYMYVYICIYTGKTELFLLNLSWLKLSIRARKWYFPSRPNNQVIAPRLEL